MESYFLIAGTALCLFSLWAIGRHDWLRLTRPSQRALGEVTGHRSSWDDNSKTYAAIYRFRDESGEHEVIDAVYRPARQPELGAIRELAYPQGHPELARPPRLWLWGGVYLLLLGLLGILAAKTLGILPD